MKKVKYTILSMLFALTSMHAQTDVTHYITNPDFEEGVGTQGWTNTGIGPKDNKTFPMTHGNIFVELWTGGGTVSDRTISQTLQNLPAGVYTLTVSAQNIKQSESDVNQKGAFIFANKKTVEVNQPADYSVTTTCTDGTLEIGARTVSCTGNWVAFDNFRLAYTIVADSLQPYLKELIAEAERVNKHQTGEIQEELDAACENAKQYVDSQNADGLDVALSRLNNAIRAYSLINASEENPCELTYLITNPSFENGTYGWTTNMGTQGNNDFSVKEGGTYLEKWTSNGNTIKDAYGSAYARQVVKELPIGNYRLTCVAQNIQHNSSNSKYEGAYIYGGVSQTPIYTRGAYEVEFTCITGEAEIGFRGDDAKGNWVAVDNFKLYYLGSSNESNQALIQARIDAAEALVNEKMHIDTLAQLNQALEAAKNITSIGEMSAIILALDNLISKANSSIKAYADLKTVIETTQKRLNNPNKNGVAELQQVVDEANTIYNEGKALNDELKQTEKRLEKAVFAFNIANPVGAAPTVTAHPTIIYGCKAAVGRLLEVSGRSILEQGFCWSESPDPTVLDNRSETVYNFNGDIYLMHDLKPSTIYYVRAYAISKTYAVGYSDVIRIITLPEAKVTYSYNWAGDQGTNDRIHGGTVRTVSFLNTWTSIRGFNASINYDAGDDGAHGSYGGWITIGAYFAQNPGTIMHEIGHGIGVGQHWRYTSWDSPLHHTMYWEGERANRVFSFFENHQGVFDSKGNIIPDSPNFIKSDGDRVHVCYGLSGVTSDIDLLRQAAYYQGLYEDGMPTVYDGACPFYSFDYNEEEKYYFTNESVGTGLKFLQEASTGDLKNPFVIDLQKLLEDDSYAWTMKFDPMTGFYHIRNAKTGKYLTYDYDNFAVKARVNVKSEDNLHLMPSRLKGSIKLKGETIPSKSYWIARSNRAETPEVLNATTSVSLPISSPQLDFYDTAKSQRWFIVSESEIKNAIEAASITEINNDEELSKEIEGYYDVAGNHLNAPQERGITIVRYKDGHAEKIIR